MGQDAEHVSVSKAGLTWLVDRRAELPPVGFQGNRPTCLSWATSTAHDYARQAAHSVEFLHHASQSYGRGIGSIGAVTAALGIDGQPPEAQWPYDASLNEMDAPPTPPAAMTGPFVTAQLAAHDVSAVAIEEVLRQGFLPVVGLRVSQEFRDAAGGVLLESTPGSDGHAVVAVAVARYDGPPTRLLQHGDRLVAVRNSWSRRWGVDGHLLVGPLAWTTLVLAALLLEPS